jgi:hypothetical protein
MDKTENKRKRRTRCDYTMGFKLQIVDAIEKGDMSYKQAQKLYGSEGHVGDAVAFRDLHRRFLPESLVQFYAIDFDDGHAHASLSLNEIV